jgi:hypothetical protein
LVDKSDLNPYLTKDYIHDLFENDNKNLLLIVNDIIDLPETDSNILPEYNPDDLKLIIKKLY